MFYFIKEISFFIIQNILVIIKIHDLRILEASFRMCLLLKISNVTLIKHFKIATMSMLLGFLRMHMYLFLIFKYFLASENGSSVLSIPYILSCVTVAFGVIPRLYPKYLSL